MKSIISTSFLLSLLLLTTLLPMGGCKEKGCTNPEAINFNSIANKDDGSCILCEGVKFQIGKDSITLFDNNFSSPHFNEAVALFRFDQQTTKYNSIECGTDECKIYVSVQSLVNETMEFPYSISCSGTVFFNKSGNVTIDGKQTAQLGPVANVSNPCQSMMGSFVSVFVNGTISYH